MGQHDQSITLQLGNVSNFVGAHIWNLRSKYLNQSGLSHHYKIDRTGYAVPRAVLVDFKDSFHRHQISSIETPKVDPLTWGRKVDVHTQSSNISEGW